MNRWHGSTIDGSAAAQADGTAADTHDIRELYPNDYGEITGESLDMYLEAAEQSRKQAHDYANGQSDQRPDENVWRYWASRDGLTDTVSGHVDEMDLADYVAYQIGTGKSKLKWKDQEKGSGRTHGLGGHLGLSGSSAERKARRAFIDDKNGMWPEEYAELLYANMPEGLRARYSDRDVLNAVLDVMRGASSRVGIMQDLASRWGSGETLEQRIERERDEWDRQQKEDMREQQEVDEQMRRNDVVATEGAEAVVDADYADLIADARARLADPNASEFEKQAARAVLRFRQRDGRGGASAQGTEGDDVRFRFTGSREDFDKMRDEAVKAKGLVMPGLADKQVRLVHVAPHDFTGSRPISQAEEWAKANIVGTHQLTDSDGKQYDYVISRNAIGKFLSASATKKSDGLNAHLSVLKHLPEVIGESIEAEVHPDYQKGEDGKRHAEDGFNNNRLVHRFYGAVDVDGKTYRVKTTIFENRDDKPNAPHSYEVTEIELLDDSMADGNNRTVNIGRNESDTKNRLSNNSMEPMAKRNASLIGVAKLLQGVEKSYDSGKLLLDESAKTTENGGMLERNGQGTIQGLEGYTEDEVLSLVREDIEEKLADAGVDGVRINGMAIHGSRKRGDARSDSDLDVVMEYDGDISEDGLFNLLYDVPLTIEGVEVDINPITEGKSGTLEQYMERSRRYDASKKADSDIRFRLRDEERRPTFYSNAERAVENVKQGKATAEQWKAMLTKAGGIKAGEDKWMGLTDWLDEHKGQSLTKDEVLQFVRDNGIRMEERTYQEGVVDPSVPEDVYNDFEDYYNRWTDDDFDTPLDHLEYAWDVYCNVSPRWIRESIEPHLYHDGTWDLRVSDRDILRKQVGINSDYSINRTRLNYTTRGLANKREIAFVVPGIEPYQEGDAIHFGPENEGRAVMWVRFGETTDKDGNRVLVIDEVQSNRHQDARESGYVPKRFDDISNERLLLSREINKFYSKLYGEGLSEEEQNERKRLITRDNELAKEQEQLLPHGREDRIPDAPFEKNWMEVAMKRMLRLAAEEGFDKVAWTTGAQQAERYGIGGVVESITKGKTRGENTLVSVQYKNGKHDSWVVAPDGKVVDGGITTGENLSDLIGKELSEKVMSLDENGSISGEGLRIGGAGMSGFYDQIVPSFMRKYVKKWGSQVGEVELATPGGEVMHSVDVTEPMRDSVLEGQPLFRVRDEARQYDEQNGTELSRFVEFLERGRRLLDGENNHFHVGNTGDILNRFGISGKITVSTTAVNKRHTNDSDHLTTEEWVKAISNINNPLAITKYGNQGKSFRIYTLVQKNGKNICVGVDVNNVGRDVNVTNVRTAFARDIVNALNESLLYPSRGELERAIQEFSSRHNREIYPEQPLSGSKGSDNSSISKINEEKTTGNGVNYRVRDGHEAAVEDARRRLESDDASEFERQAARAVIKAYGGGSDDTPDGGGPRFRIREPQKAIEDYERAVNSSGFQVTEALQDRMMGLKKLMQVIVGKDAKGKEKAIQDIAGFENAYLKENRLQSESVAQVDEYRTKYYSPLVKAVSALCPTEAPCVSVAPYPI